MGEKIEFDAAVETVYKAYNDDHGSTLVVFNCIGVPSDAKVGYKYHVIMEPVRPELKPCPFCGEEATVLDDKVIACTGCGVLIDWFPKLDQAIQAWNRRSNEQED